MARRAGSKAGPAASMAEDIAFVTGAVSVLNFQAASTGVWNTRVLSCSKNRLIATPRQRRSLEHPSTLASRGVLKTWWARHCHLRVRVSVRVYMVGAPLPPEG